MLAQRWAVWSILTKKADGLDATKPTSENLQNGDLRTAIVEVMMNDDAVMQPIIDAVSEPLVAKLS